MTEREAPAWYRSGSALQSAVEHLAAAFPSFNWVGVYVLRGDTLELGPYIGAPTEHTRIKVGVGVCGTAVARSVRHERARRSCARQLPGLQDLTARTRCPGACARWADSWPIDIDSHTPAAFGPAEEAAVRQVADELGRLW